MKIYPRILLNTLPLIFAGLLVVGGLTYYLSLNAMANLAEKWLATKLDDAIRIASEDVEVLRKYGLANIDANVAKAQAHAGKAIRAIVIGESGYLWVVNANDIIVEHPDASQVGVNVSKQKWFQGIQGRLRGKCHHQGHGGKLMAVYHYFSPWGWYIMASAPQSELYGEANRMRSYVLGIGLVALAITAIVLMIVARRLTAPLNALAREAECIGRGDRQEVAKLERADEIGTLATAFSRMTHLLGRRITQAKLMSDISRQFIHLSSGQTNEIIQTSLQKIGEYTGADRSYVGQFSMDDRLVGNTHEWCRDGVDPQTDNMQGLSLEAIPWLMDHFERQKLVLAPVVNDLPPEAEAEKKLWLQRGIQSVARVPMTYGGELRGFVGLDAIREPRSWSNEDVQLLMRVGEIICNALERQWYQERLSAEKERLAVTLQSIGDGVITTDVDGRVVLINRVGETLTGWLREEVANQPIGEVFTILDENSRQRLDNPIARVIQTGWIKAVPTQSLLISRDGTERVISNSVAPIYDKEGKIIGVVLVFRDVTDKRRMEEEMLRVEKLESIGVLAGGIAHDFNNILTAIIGNLSLAKRHVEPGSKVIAKMEEIEKASLRARDLTQRLLTFSKGGEPVKKTISFKRVFYDSALFALGGSNVGLAYTPPDDLWPVEADEGQISQVINNLVLNAIQAMPDGGVIQAGLENFSLPASSPLPQPAGQYVKLSLKDQGTGISKSDLGRVFDPFFTTKAKGSGLGLATAYAVIEKHGGYITVDSGLNQGTTFTIYLPASDQKVSQVAKVQAVATSGSGKILVMDDEKIIRDVAGGILTSVGYTVALSKDGQEMLDAYVKAQKNGSAFDVVLMDLTIPGGMGGKEAIQKLLEIDPKAKAIVSSGYSTDPVMSDFARYGFAGAVSKPYTIDDICYALNNVLLPK